MKENGSVVVSVVIPAYHGAATIEMCLQSLLAATRRIPSEIIVVDSSEDDATQKAVENVRDVKLIRHTSRLSAGAARMVGARSAQGEIVVFIDQDCRVKDNHILRIVSHFKDTKISCVGGSVNLATPSDSGALMLYFLEYLYHFPGVALKSAKYGFLIGCNCAARRSVLDIVAFPDLTMTEDLLFSQLARQHGYLIRYDPSLVVENVLHSGIRRNLAYLRELGRASARYHTRYAPNRIAILRRLPIVVFASSIPVMGMIAHRLIQGSDWSLLRRFLLLLPLCIVGHLFWASGFFREMTHGEFIMLV